MLKDHKSAIHLEAVTFDKDVRNLNGTEEFLNFLLIRNNAFHTFLRQYVYVSNHNVTPMNVSKQYKENRGGRAFLTVRKHQINLLPSNNFLPKIDPFTSTVPFTYFMGYSESILCYLT